MSHDRSDAGLAMDQAVTSPAWSSPDLEISVLGPRTRYALRTRPASMVRLQSLSGLTLPARIGQSVDDGAIRIFCLGPDEWLLTAEDEDNLAAKFDPGDPEGAPLPFSLVDISHRNVAVQIEGPKAEAAIRTGCPLDLDPAFFPVGKVSRTVFERAEIILFRKAKDVFEIEIWRSFAPYLLALLDKAAKAV